MLPLYFSAGVRLSSRLSLLEGHGCKTGVTLCAVHVQPCGQLHHRHLWPHRESGLSEFISCPFSTNLVCSLGFDQVQHFQISSAWNIRTFRVVIYD